MIKTANNPSFRYARPGHRHGSTQSTAFDTHGKQINGGNKNLKKKKKKLKIKNLGKRAPNEPIVRLPGLVWGLLAHLSQVT